jgi:3-deoxy-7-phosphoheptulonate synthase/chorismate mutase
MTDPQIQALRDQVDAVNLEILQALNARAALVTQIGARQTELGQTHFDPKRESEMLEMIVAANQGPFSSATVKGLFKEIFKASLDLEEKQDKPKFKYSRKAHPEDTTVTVSRGAVSVTFGGPQKVLIAGPCSIENEAQMRSSAAFLKQCGVTLMRGGAYKPRTSPYGFQGLGVPGLELGAMVARENDLLFVAEVMDTRDVEVTAQYADMLQIGTRNAQNFALLKAVGKAGKPVLLKRGMSSTMEEWLLTAEYVLAEGNDQIVLCERGIRTFEKWTRNTLDLSAVAVAKLETHLPVIVDVTHAAGRTDILTPLAKAALAVGADGVHIEVHPDPATALSDNQQQLDFAGFERFLKDLGPVWK